jgi:hypothetical protein
MYSLQQVAQSHFSQYHHDKSLQKREHSMNNTFQLPMYQVKITLKDIEPPIWRRFVVPMDIDLVRFHKIIQMVMGWQNAHLHLFKIDSLRFTNPYEPSLLEELTAIDSRHVKLSHIVPINKPYRKKAHLVMQYEYDFGDSWEHEIVFETVVYPDTQQQGAKCLEGKRACPPEDVGGIFRYQYFLEAMADPNHPEHEELMEWYGESFDSEAFDIDTVNKKLTKLK